MGNADVLCLRDELGFFFIFREANELSSTPIVTQKRETNRQRIFDCPFDLWSSVDGEVTRMANRLASKEKSVEASPINLSPTLGRPFV
jgi:hypothetical protein